MPGVDHPLGNSGRWCARHEASYGLRDQGTGLSHAAHEAIRGGDAELAQEITVRRVNRAHGDPEVRRRNRHLTRNLSRSVAVVVAVYVRRRSAEEPLELRQLLDEWAVLEALQMQADLDLGELAGGGQCDHVGFAEDHHADCVHGLRPHGFEDAVVVGVRVAVVVSDDDQHGRYSASPQRSLCPRRGSTCMAEAPARDRETSAAQGGK